MKGLLDKIRNKKILGYTISQYVLFALFCSLCGFVAENTGRIITLGNFDSRYMLLPFIMPYGLGVLAAYLVLGRPSEFRFFGWRFIKGDGRRDRNIRRVLYFVAAFVCISAGEAGYGLLVEATTGKRLWNYSNIPLHVTQYTSIPTSILFTSGVFVVTEYLMPALMRFFEKISSRAIFVVSAILFVLSFADMIAMMIRLFVTGTAKQFWSVNLPWCKIASALI